MAKINCLFCDKPFEKRNQNQIFCSKDCGYCYRQGGVPYRQRGWHWSDDEQRIVKSDLGKQQKKEPERKVRERKSVKYIPRGREGVVYLIEAREQNLYKIGRAKNIQHRMNGLARDIPIPMTVIHTISSRDCIEAEKVLHNRYAEARVRFEWFNLSSKQVGEILAIRDGELDL